VSLRHIVPVGGFDLAEVAGPIALRLSSAGDTFLALDAQIAAVVAPGEVAYADGHTILTRHFVWRQARTALLTPITQAVFLVSEVLGDLGAEVAWAVLADLRDGLTGFFGVTPTAALLVDAEHAEIAW